MGSSHSGNVEAIYVDVIANLASIHAMLLLKIATSTRSPETTPAESSNEPLLVYCRNRRTFGERILDCSPNENGDSRRLRVAAGTLGSCVAA
jgi:hypothetical protein